MVVNASWRSYIIHHAQSGFSCSNHKGEGDNNHNVVNKEIIMGFNQGGVHGSNTLRIYMVVNAVEGLT